MRKIIPVVVLAMALAGVAVAAGTASAQGGREVSVAVLDPETFVTVQGTGTGDIILLYKVQGGRIRLVDAVFSGTARDPQVPRRYLHHSEVDNR